MQRYFIHCQWSLNSTCMHVVYLGECAQAEAEEKFEAAVKETQEYELMTLDDGAAHEICRYTKTHAISEDRQPAPTPMQQLRNLFWSSQTA